MTPYRLLDVWLVIRKAIPIFIILLLFTISVSAQSLVRFGATGDFGSTSNTGAVLDRTVTEDVDFLLGMGDYTYGDLDEPDWCDFIDGHLGTMPFQLGIGNHDDRDDAPEGHGDIRQLTNCFPDQYSSDGDYGVEYAFTAGAARIIVTAMDIPFEGSDNTYWPDTTPEFEWLDEQIQDAKTAGQWIIVMTHKNCITHADGFPDCEINKKLFNYLLTEEVDLILQGHTHGYGRTKQLKLNSTTCTSFSVTIYDSDCHKPASQTTNHTVFNSGSGSLVVINGTGGKNLLPYDSDRGAINYFAKKWASNLNPKYGVTIVRVESDKLTIKYSRTTGDEDDWFTINR